MSTTKSPERDGPLPSGKAAGPLARLAHQFEDSPTVRQAANWWFLAFVGYLLVLPAGLNIVLLPILAMTAGIGVARLLAQRLLGRPPVKVRRLMLLPALAGLIPVTVGAVVQTQGWLDVAVPLVAAPLTWFVLSAAADEWVVDRLLSAVAVATLVLLTFFLMLLTGIGRPLVRMLQPNAFGLIGSGIPRVSLAGAASLIGIVPLLGTALFDSYRRNVRLRNHSLIVAGFAASVVASVLTGRQGVMGAMAITPVLILGVSVLGFRLKSTVSHSSETLLRAVAGLFVVAIGLAGGAYAIGIDPVRVPLDLLGAVGIESGLENGRVRVSASVRERQSASFIEGWKEQPFLGHGAGKVSPDFSTWRGYAPGTPLPPDARPWRAEMHYHLLLFESGIIGIGAYLAVIGTVLFKVRSRFLTLGDPERLLVRAGLVSAAALLVASAYNPLVRALGHQLVLYWPIIFLSLLATPALADKSGT